MSTVADVILSCDRSLYDWRNKINKYSACGCREKWQEIKSTVCASDVDKHKQFINNTTGAREIHIVRCGHVWYGVK